ncbi:Pyridoxal 5'-phosphate synthase-like subunit PDX1.2 [Abeliophyllum distichum]|uniref:Pyridoxal 5'-phosphate synthase-like subunit PDX1.2 n=1 Tax=Abeliophyllum distichum TaxID=126358 RepID=A0ABD1TIA3_9LAMI
MVEDNAVMVYGSNAVITDAKKNPFLIKVGMAQMLRGGTIVEVTTVEQAKIAESENNPFSIKVVMAQMLRGGAIVEVTTVEQAKIVESAGACCVIVSDPPREGIPACMIRP